MLNQVNDVTNVKTFKRTNMVFIFKRFPHGRLTGLLLFVSVIISLSCTSTYHGPPRFSYENRRDIILDQKTGSVDQSVSSHRNSKLAVSEKVTTINKRDYVTRRTANNLWYLVEKQPEDKSNDNAIDTGYCPVENNRNDSTFCYNVINTFCEISEILVNLTGFNPIIRTFIVASLKYLKPLLYLMCNGIENEAAPGYPLASRT